MSDLSHSIEDSEPAASICSSSSSDDAAESSSLADETMAEPAIEQASGLASKEEPVLKLNQELARGSLVMRQPEETESALELKVEEAENSRHSAIGLYPNMFHLYYKGWNFYTSLLHFLCTKYLLD